MKTSNHVTLDRLVGAFTECLTAESAQRLLAMKADRRLQQHINRLAKKCAAGTLTPEERQAYESYVSFGTFVALIKSKARLILNRSASA